MKKLILIICLSFFSFPVFAETLSLRILTVTYSSEYKSLSVKNRYGVSYEKNNYRVGINEGFDRLPVIHAVKNFPVNNFLTFGAGLETGYTAYKASSKYYLKSDYNNLNFMLSLNVKLHKNISVFLTGNNASLEFNF